MQYYELHDYQVPRQINCEKLVCVMNRELAKADVRRLMNKYGFIVG